MHNNHHHTTTAAAATTTATTTTTSPPIIVEGVHLHAVEPRRRGERGGGRARLFDHRNEGPAQHTHAAPTLPLGDTPNTRALPQTLALRC